MSFLLRSALAIAAVYFLLHRNEFVGSPTPARGGATLASAERGAVNAREGAMSALQRAAAAKLVGAAREHCLTDPRDCLALMKAAGAEFG